jgi:DNA mismatch repair ATPase MutS
MPITFIITHLYEIFNNHLVNLCYEVRFLNAIIYREEEGRTLTFLYKIKPGLFRDSVAIESCKSLGV